MIGEEWLVQHWTPGSPGSLGVSRFGKHSTVIEVERAGAAVLLLMDCLGRTIVFGGYIPCALIARSAIGDLDEPVAVPFCPHP